MQIYYSYQSKIGVVTQETFGEKEIPTIETGSDF